MKTAYSLVIMGLLLSSCGENTNYENELNKDGANTSQISETPSTGMNYALLSPSKSKINAVNFIDRGTPLAESDKRYVKLEVSKDKKNFHNNHINFPEGVKNVVISGKHLVLNDVDLQGIRKPIHNQNDIASVTFKAEVIDVECPLNVPGTNLTIYARTLNMKRNAKIDVTPLAFKTKAAQFQDGKGGQNGGTISLNLESISIDSNIKEPIFTARGGNGQDAGEGQDGTKGSDVRDLGGQVTYLVKIHDECRSIRGPKDISKEIECSTKTTIDGELGWPGNGTNAIAGGNPGLPGNGGKFISNLKFDAGLVDLIGGKSGNPVRHYVGGASGTPVTAYHRRNETNNRGKNDVFITDSNTATKGADAKSPGIKRERGDVGKILTDDSKSWLNEGYFEFAIKYAEDLYKINMAEEAQHLVNEVLVICNKLEGQNHTVLFTDKYCHEGSLQNQKISAGLDYYGNPLVWVPNLSYEANYQLFNTEVERSFNILYLTYWLRRTQNSLEERRNAIMASQDQQMAQIDEDSKNFNTLVDRIPGLKKNLADIQVDENTFKQELAKVEAAILAQAERNVDQRHRVPFYKKAVKILAAISKVIPVGQPHLGAIATTVDAVVQGMGTERPWQDVIDTLPDTVSAFQPDNLRHIREDWNKKRENIQYGTYREVFSLRPETSGLSVEEIKARKKEYLKNLGDFMKPIGKELANTAGTNQHVRVPQSEVEEEIQKIKSAHPLFKEISEKLEALVAKRKDFAQEINQIESFLGKIVNDIATSYQSIAKLSEAQAALESGIDSNLKSSLGDIEEQAKDRLDKYNYLMAKAYHYRMLKKFPGDLDLGPVMKKIEALVKVGHNGALSFNEFREIKGIYENQMSKVVESIVNELNHGSVFHNTAIRSFNLSTEQIKALNEGHTIYLDLKSKNIFGDDDGGQSLQDVRINNIKVSNMEFDVTGIPRLIAEGTLNLRYSGASYIKRSGVYYLFDFGNTTSKSRLKWGGTKNILKGTMNDITPSYADDSLLHSLLQSDEDLLLFARPGGLTDLKVNLTTLTDEGTKALLQEATIEIEYDYLID
ncbi:MAG: hypothetical protein HYV97_15460 [Bdellovibrio sp.]|nr:hypothetical protein [Bdellovibrio sp.]